MKIREWTYAWFIFITWLCLIFNNGWPLLLLFIWVTGINDGE